MKRRAILAMASAAAIGGAVVVHRRRARPSATAAPAPTEIADGVFCAGPWGRTQTNVHLVRSGDAWVLVDAGWAQDAERIRSALHAISGPASTVTAIVLTHVHPDHAGAARELAEAWGCPILVHPAEMPIACGDFEAMVRYAGPLDRWVILPLMKALGRRRREAVLEAGSLGEAARGLPGDGSIPGLDGWRWIPTPGHTPGHVAVVRDRDRVVISGDALLTLRVNTAAGMLRGSQGLSGPPWYTTWDPAAARASIQVIADLEPSVLATGHGHPLAGSGTAAAIRRFATQG